MIQTPDAVTSKEKRNNFSLQIKNTISSMKLRKNTRINLLYTKLISGHYVSYLIALHRLLSDVGVILCEFVIPPENIRSRSGITSAVHRKILVITSSFFFPLLSGSVHP